MKESTRGVSAKAQQAEDKAFKTLLNKLEAKAIVSPAGFDAGFPDFAYRMQLTTGKVIDVHVEYKADAKAQMGSMRDWIFNGRSFETPDPNNEAKADLIDIMNSTPQAIANGKRLLKDLQTYFDPSVSKISSGSLSVIKDKKERFIKTKAFADGTEHYQIAAIADASMGDKIIRHYKTKFKKNLKTGSKGSILLMMLKDKVWLVDEAGTITADEMKEIAERFGADKFNKMTGLKAKLEVRIQPRGLSSGGSKPTSIDVMASFRLNGEPSGGAKVI